MRPAGLTESQKVNPMTPRMRRIVLAAKVGVAAAITGLLALMPSAHAMSGGKGPWAVITVTIVMQATLGATVSKVVQRCLGTACAAVCAAVAGSAARQLPTPWNMCIVLAAILFCTVALNFTSTSPDPCLANWSYAFFMFYLTFDFLALQAYNELVSDSLWRVVMILIGAATALLVAILPPQLNASDLVQLMLADMLRSTATAFEAAVSAYADGRKLHRLEAIDLDPDKSDDVYAAWRLAR